MISSLYFSLFLFQFNGLTKNEMVSSSFHSSHIEYWTFQIGRKMINTFWTRSKQTPRKVRNNVNARHHATGAGENGEKWNRIGFEQYVILVSRNLFNLWRNWWKYNVFLTVFRYILYSDYSPKLHTAQWSVFDLEPFGCPPCFHGQMCLIHLMKKKTLCLQFTGQ